MSDIYVNVIGHEKLMYDYTEIVNIKDLLKYKEDIKSIEDLENFIEMEVEIDRDMADTGDGDVGKYYDLEQAWEEWQEMITE